MLFVNVTEIKIVNLNSLSDFDSASRSAIDGGMHQMFVCPREFYHDLNESVNEMASSQLNKSLGLDFQAAITLRVQTCLLFCHVAKTNGSLHDLDDHRCLEL